MMEQAITVSQLNRQAKFILQEHFTGAFVSGEISNLSRPRSGHVYFTLKDQHAQVRCAFFRGRAAQQRYQLREGDAVLVRGQVSLYEGRGDYQIIVSGVQPAGDGALQIAFEALKRKLEAEGLFAPERKRPLPQSVTRLGVITSASGAALQDILQVLARRDPGIEVIVYACTVQGKDVAPEIRRTLHRALQDTTLDALLIARGGGSAEDLWCFNDEQLARDIAAATLPIVSAIGHETDFTIADFVADMRAPTPSAGAEMLSTDQSVWRHRLQQIEQRLVELMRRHWQDRRTRVEHLRLRLRHPRERIQEQQQRLDEQESRLQRALMVRLAQSRQRLSHQSARLAQASPRHRVARQRQQLAQWEPRLQNAMEHFMSRQRETVNMLARNLHVASPLATLERGYSIILDPQQRNIVRSISQVEVGDQLEHRVSDGTISSKVTGVNPKGGS